ncbi:uncharacterized protein LOC135445134 [Zonotrichia leucophrys gambelii]|uniref:uncharacterized protein LOC135445134 n=1 Tax=Zonotrichia leucophrys gambelii TaxID=257770 RepID=UPI00314085B8
MRRVTKRHSATTEHSVTDSGITAPESSIEGDVNWEGQRHLGTTGTLEKPGLIRGRGNSPTQPRVEAPALLTGLLLVLLQDTALCMHTGLLGTSPKKFLAVRSPSFSFSNETLLMPSWEEWFLHLCDPAALMVPRNQSLTRFLTSPRVFRFPGVKEAVERPWESLGKGTEEDEPHSLQAACQPSGLPVRPRRGAGCGAPGGAAGLACRTERSGAATHAAERRPLLRGLRKAIPLNPHGGSGRGAEGDTFKLPPRRAAEQTCRPSAAADAPRCGRAPRRRCRRSAAERRAGLRARPALLPRRAGPAGCLQVTADLTPHPALAAFQLPKPKTLSQREKPVRVGSKAEASRLQTLPTLPAPGAGCRHRQHFSSRAPRGLSHVGGFFDQIKEKLLKAAGGKAKGSHRTERLARPASAPRRRRSRWAAPRSPLPLR